MNTTIKVFPNTDELMERYNAQAFMYDIPDMNLYAQAWQRLGNEASQQNRPALAEMCYGRAKHYSEYAGGKYYRVVNGCLAELHSAGVREPGGEG